MSAFDLENSDAPSSTPPSGRPAGTHADEESGIARVLRAAGGRAQPSDSIRNAVREAVRAEWRATIAKRRQRRVWLAAAASVAVAAFALWISRSLLDTQDAPVASVSRSVGVVESREGSWGGWQAATAAKQFRSGDSLITGADGRAALELRDGVSLRLDHDTRIAFVDAGHIDVLAGAVYVDSGVTPDNSEHLQVGTPAGIVRHVGTQYEARILSGATRIRVREGRVDVIPTHGTAQSARVGEQLVVAASGNVERGSIAPSDAEWSWAESAAPPFDIDGRPVREFLNWVGREVGREVVFATPASEAEANRAVLSGSVAGLAPAEALAAVLPTTSLRSIERDGQIVIALSANP